MRPACTAAQREQLKSNLLIGMGVGGSVATVGSATHASLVGTPIRECYWSGISGIIVGGCYAAFLSGLSFLGFEGYPAHLCSGVTTGFLVGGVHGGNITHSTRSAIGFGLLGCLGLASTRTLVEARRWWITPTPPKPGFWTFEWLPSWKKREAPS